MVSHNVNVSSGVVKALINNVSCGSFTVVHGGFYGVLSCNGRDMDSTNMTKGVNGSDVTFLYNGNPATATGDATFTSGTFKMVNVTFPLVICGDAFCDALESCSICPEDCFQCNATGNATGNNTGNGTIPSGGTTPGGGGTGGGGGGGGGGAGGGGGGAGGAMSGGETCTENWMCMNWTKCSFLGVTTRNCTDINKCGSYATKPKEVQECIYEGNCFDNLINCHDDKCEEGIDCGGPCDKKCPIFEQPLGNITIKLPKLEIPKHVCEKHIDFKDPAIWIFLLIILLAIISRQIYTRYIINKLRKNPDIAPLIRAKKVNSLKRKTLLFSVTLFFLAIVAFLYSYYFLLCPTDFFDYSWLLLVLLLLIPLVIHTAMKKFEYSDVEHFDKSKRLDDVHYQSIVRMIDMENSILAEEENNIANKLYELSKKKEFMELIDNNRNLKDVYANMIKLYTQYSEKKNPFNLEKDVCDEINALDADIVFKKAVESNPEMRQIFARLKRLYAQYEEKQKLYDKLDQLEHEEKDDAKGK